MGTFRIKQGRDIQLKGEARKEIFDIPLPPRIAVQPQDFRGLNLRLLIHKGDTVLSGVPIAEDKDNQKIKIVTPVSGRVLEIQRAEKRALSKIIIETDSKQKFLEFKQHSADDLKHISAQEAIECMLKGGLWPFIRQRPFSKIADPSTRPKSIFIKAINSDPLALDVDFVLDGYQELFQIGIDIISKLTDGNLHLCMSPFTKSKALLEAEGVIHHRFLGPHPSGNVSTHIHYIDPINKGDIVWYISALDVLNIASFFLNGIFWPVRYVAVTGEGASRRVYAKTVIGAPLLNLLEDKKNSALRYISGSVLSGNNVGPEGFLGFYDSQITVIPEGGKREFLGWIRPGLKKYSFSRTFLSSLFCKKKVSLNTDKHGDNRAIVFNHLYDSLVTLDVMTYFLVRAVIAGDFDEAERLGILECDEEDFALCTFVCPSKTNIGAIIRRGLDVIEKEG